MDQIHCASQEREWFGAWLHGIRRSPGYFARAQVLPFSAAAADVYDELRRSRVRVGAMDLRIASIVIANQMTLLTRNTVDFERVPDLPIEDWTVSSPP
jgi:predicted nucleic acid-binding protein